MAQILLPLVLLASRVICDQIIYPDQYEMMMKTMSTIAPYPSYAFPANNGRVESAAYPVSNINQANQFNRESAPPFLKAANPLYTTPASASMRPTASPESSPDWGSHVNCYNMFLYFIT
jgi:hypothetical protein